jgi:glycosyltransferase involved in cell wall biosynthesis
LSHFVVSAYAPARTSGRGVRSCSVIAALAQLGPVEVAYVPFDGGEPAADLAADERVALHRVEPSRGALRVMTALVAAAHGATIDFARAASPELIRAARAAPRDARLVVDGPTAAAAVLPLRRSRDAIYLAHNLENSFRGTPALRRFERRILRGFGESWLPTHADMEGARLLAGRELRVRHAPNVVDVQAIPVSRSRPGRLGTLLVGDFTYEPNREGLAHLVERVMPLVWKELPDATVDVAGRGIEDPPADSRVRVLGYVDNLDAAYAAADAVAVPLLTGGGSPLKFVEALARGVPVVSTAHAAALIEAGTNGEQFLAAPDAEGFAAALVSVLRGEHPELGERARALAERQFSIEALAEKLRLSGAQ